MYGDQFGEFVCGYWGLKGYKRLKTIEDFKTVTLKSGRDCL